MREPVKVSADFDLAERPRRFHVFRRGLMAFAIPENEVATVVAWRRLAPLPRSPESVLGVASVQGRMLTVLDPATLLSNPAGDIADVPQQIAALRGDEQLALAVDSEVETIEIRGDDIRDNHGNSPLVVCVHQRGDMKINVLNVKELFRSSVLGRERRHRRF